MKMSVIIVVIDWKLLHREMKILDDIFSPFLTFDGELQNQDMNEQEYLHLFVVFFIQYL